MTSQVELSEEFDLFDPEVRQDPYPFLARLRERDPVHWSPAWEGWILSRYDDVAAALRDTRLSLGGGAVKMFERLPKSERDAFEPLRRHISLWMGSCGDTDHARLRAWMSRALTEDFVSGMRGFCQTVSEELVADMFVASGGGRVDAVRDFAHPLPAIVIARMLGAPQEDWSLFRSWSEHLTRFLGVGVFEPTVLARAQDAVLEMSVYIEKLLAGPSREDGLLQRLQEEIRSGARIDKEELIANCVLLLFAGHETTSILIGNSLLSLLRHGDPNSLRKDPSGWPAAIQECLRFESPIQMVRRSADEDLRIRGCEIREGEVVWLSLGAANRDRDRFVEPDRFDPGRPRNRQIGFGLGMHYCLGAGLALMETEVALATLLRRLPGLRLDVGSGETLQWKPSPTARSLESLPIAFGRADS